MTYEWDPDKARANVIKHHIRFADAVIALEDERALTAPDIYFEEEARWVNTRDGFVRRLLAVVYAWRAENIRVISARMATQRERRQYEESSES
jgi:uncharacterized protein